jgi:hypothetical protein
MLNGSSPVVAYFCHTKFGLDSQLKPLALFCVSVVGAYLALSRTRMSCQWLICLMLKVKKKNRRMGGTP